MENFSKINVNLSSKLFNYILKIKIPLSNIAKASHLEEMMSRVVVKTTEKYKPSRSLLAWLRNLDFRIPNIKYFA